MFDKNPTVCEKMNTCLKAGPARGIQFICVNNCQAQVTPRWWEGAPNQILPRAPKRLGPALAESKHMLCKWPPDSSRLSDVSTCYTAWRQGGFKHTDPSYEAALTSSDWPLTLRSGCVNQEHIHIDTLTKCVFVLCLILSKVSLPGTGTLRQVTALLFFRVFLFSSNILYSQDGKGINPNLTLTNATNTWT